MNILITGGTGFVGSHMIDYIFKYKAKHDDKVYCTKRWMEDTKNVDHIDDDRFEFIDCDLLDGASVQRAIVISKPDKVFHFAAQSFPEVSFKIPVITLQTNVVGTTYLLEAIKNSEYNFTEYSQFINSILKRDIESDDASVYILMYEISILNDDLTLANKYINKAISIDKKNENYRELSFTLNEYLDLLNRAKKHLKKIYLMKQLEIIRA